MYKLFKVSHFPVKNGEMARYCIGRADNRSHPRLDSAINQEVGARLGRSHQKKLGNCEEYILVFALIDLLFFRKACLLRPRYLETSIQSLASVSLS